MHKTLIALAISSAFGSAQALEIVMPTVTVTGSAGSIAGGTMGGINMSIVPRGSVITYGGRVDEPGQPLSWRPRFPGPAQPGTPLAVVGAVAAIGGLAVPPPAGPVISAIGTVANATGNIVNATAPPQTSGTFPTLAPNPPVYGGGACCSPP